MAAKKIRMFGKPMSISLIGKIIALKIAIILMATGFGFRNWIYTKVDTAFLSSIRVRPSDEPDEQGKIAMKDGIWVEPSRSVLAVLSLTLAISAVSFSIIHGKLHFATSLQIIASIVLSGVLIAMFVSDYSILSSKPKNMVTLVDFGPGFYLQVSSTVVLIVALAFSLAKGGK